MYSPRVHKLADYFGADSPLQQHLPGFQPRAGQGWMAEAVAEAMETSAKLVVEAGTGTGKTFAYLIPALLSGQKTIISTGTKALQDQLYHRDLPLVGKALGRPVTTALLKGRANYLCLHRLETSAESAAGPAVGGDLAAVQAWRHRTASGDRAELIEVSEESPVWPLVTSTAENCLGSDCPVYQKCHVVRARRAAQEADLVVVNHHLLLADLAMKESGFLEFLPDAETIILDEAHQIPDLAAQFFGISVGTRELERLFDELRGVTLPLKDAKVQRAIDDAATAVRVLRAEAPRDEGRHELATWLDELRQPLIGVRAALDAVVLSLDSIAADSVEIDKLGEQLVSLVERWSFFIEEDSWDGLRWLEIRARSLRLHLTPLDVAGTLSGLFNAAHQSWIFTSATLAVGEDFDHFTSRTGLGEATALTFPSPYSLQENGLVWLPPDLPEPADRNHTAAMLETVTPLLELTSGGMFCLFTSHRALSNAKRWAARHRGALAGRELLVQGEAPRDDLLRRFREIGDAVLFGTGSFWEGVDVRGKALTVVAIDKLPFTSPADPLLMARLEFIKRQGGNGFMDHQLPLAVLALKQGAGRLLRDETDYGVVVICDPRVAGRRYGKVFLDSLAPMPVTSGLTDVAAFLARHERPARRRSGVRG